LPSLNATGFEGNLASQITWQFEPRASLPLTGQLGSRSAASSCRRRQQAFAAPTPGRKVGLPSDPATRTHPINESPRPTLQPLPTHTSSAANFSTKVARVAAGRRSNVQARSLARLARSDGYPVTLMIGIRRYRSPKG
jgi:hypothetical protein